MVLRRVVPIVTVMALISSSPLFAKDGGALRQSPTSAVEISSTSIQQASPEAVCQLKVKERYEYYDIDGSTVSDLQRQMKHNGTKWDDGKTYAALTTWNLNFRYDLSEDDGRCSIKSVRTDVDIVYHLPRRVTASGSDFTPAWEKYMAHLKKHEFGHKDITVKAAGEINEVLASLPAFANSDELEQEAKRRTDEKLRELRELQLAYDNETRHGETQGAILAAQ